MAAVSADNKAMARHVAGIFGGTPRVGKYWDEPEISSIDVLSVVDRPTPGVISFCTIGLSDVPIPDYKVTPPLGAEIVAVNPAPEFAAALATAAFCVVNSGWVAEPDRVFPNVVGMHFEGTTVPHLMFSDPYLWDLDSLVLETKTVAWILAVPISEAELALVEKEGADALTDLLESSDVDLCDLRRASAV